MNEDPHQHLATFEEHCATFAGKGEELDALKLNCFHLSLTDDARTWLRLLNPAMAQTWQDVQRLFLGKYFPPSKTQHFRQKITTFKQGEHESLSEAYDRWQELLRLCPNHGIDIWLLFQFFYAGCTYATKAQLNASAGGNIANRDSMEAMELIEDMAISQREWTSARDARNANTPVGVLKVDEITAMQAKMESLQVAIKQLQQVKAVQTPSCAICNGNDHETTNCQFYTAGGDQVEQVNGLFYNEGDKRNPPNYPNYNQNNYNRPYQNQGNGQTYQNRPNQGQNNQYQNQNRQNQAPSQMTKMEKMIEGLVDSQNKLLTNQTEFSDSLRSLNERVELLTTRTRMLETQVAQQAASSSRPQGQLPGKPDVNPIERVNAISLRSGREYQAPEIPDQEEQQMHQDEAGTTLPTKSTIADCKKKGKSNPEKVKLSESSKYIPPHRFVPFPQRLLPKKLDHQFARFAGHLSKLNITIPFTEAITQIPTYAKFLKEILSNKRTIEEVGTVTLNEECSALISNTIPPKLKDPGSFTIPTKIGNVNFDRCLCDLGASVSVMPFSVYQRLGLGDLKSTKMSLLLADKTVRFPKGILEDTLIQIGKYFVPVDFVVVEMEEDTHTPLLLGRDFLITAGANIDVKGGKISFDIGGDKVHFDMSHSIKLPSINNESICRVEVMDSTIAAQNKEASRTTVRPPCRDRTNNNTGSALVPQYAHYYQICDISTPVRTIVPPKASRDAHARSVVPPDTDNKKKFDKGDQVWFSKSILMRLIKKLKLKSTKKFEANWSEPFKITTTYPTGGLELSSAATGSIKVKRKSMKYFLPQLKVEKNSGGILSAAHTT